MPVQVQLTCDVCGTVAHAALDQVPKGWVSAKVHMGVSAPPSDVEASIYPVVSENMRVALKHAPRPPTRAELTVLLSAWTAGLNEQDNPRTFVKADIALCPDHSTGNGWAKAWNKLREDVAHRQLARERIVARILEESELSPDGTK